MSLSSGGPCEITVPRAGAWLAPRVFIHGRPSTLTPCPSVVQLVIVMPTPPCSHARYALCPALHPPVLYNRYSASGVCTAGPCPLRGLGWPSYKGQSLQSGCGLCWRLITSPNNRVHTPAASAFAVSPRLSAACPATDSRLLADSVLSTLSGIFFCRLPPFPTLSRHAF